MKSEIYIAIISSDYQELNLKRFINHFNLNNKIIIFEYYKNKSSSQKFPKNVTKKVFKNKLSFLISFFLFLLKNFSYKINFIFSNPFSRFASFLSRFISGNNQFYLDDGFDTIYYDFKKSKKNTTVFTLYNIKVPIKIKKILYTPKYKKKFRKTSNKILFIGTPFVSHSNRPLSKNKFKEIFEIISKLHKKFYYYPHSYEIDELSLLPKNFKILKRIHSVENYIYNSTNDFKLIYSFGSSSLIEIANFYKKDKLRLIDISNLEKNSDKTFFKNQHMKKIIILLKKYGIKVIKLK